MQTYDMIMLLILVSATIFGAIKGFAWQIASIASIVASYFVAYYFRNDMAKVINAQYPWNLFLAMLVLYGGTSFFIWMIFRLVSSTIDKVRPQGVRSPHGSLFGFGKGIAYCLLVTMFAMTLLGADKQRAICSSRSGYYMSKILAGADGLLPKKSMRYWSAFGLSRAKLEKGRDGHSSMHPIPSVILWVGATITLNQAFLIRGAFSVSQTERWTGQTSLPAYLVAWRQVLERNL